VFQSEQKIAKFQAEKALCEAESRGETGLRGNEGDIQGEMRMLLSDASLAFPLPQGLACVVMQNAASARQGSSYFVFSASRAAIPHVQASCEPNAEDTGS